MAEKNLIGVDRSESATVAEVEHFKLVRSAEKALISALRVMVEEYLLKVGPKNPLYQSLSRLLRAKG